MKFIAIVASLVFAAAIPMQSGAVKDQTVTTWSIKGEEGDRREFSLTVHSGVLELREVGFCSDCGSKGSTKSWSVKLDDVRRFDKNTLKGGDSDFGFIEPVHRIGIITRTDHDMVETDIDGHSRTRPGLPGFAIFSIDQKKLRDDTYEKLCAMIGQTL